MGQEQKRPLRATSVVRDRPSQGPRRFTVPVVGLPTPRAYALASRCHDSGWVLLDSAQVLYSGVSGEGTVLAAMRAHSIPCLPEKNGDPIRMTLASRHRYYPLSLPPPFGIRLFVTPQSATQDRE
jgi:hypothetical protein